MRRLFCFVFVFIMLVTVCYADDESSVYSDDDFSSAISGAVDNYLSSRLPDEQVDTDQSSLESDSQFPIFNTSNYFVVGDFGYSYSDIAEAFYSALVQSELDSISEFSEISDLSVMPIFTPDNSSTPIPSTSLRAVLTNIIGPYSPVVVQYQYNNGSNTAYLREIMPDYVWMFSVGLFALVLYCVFRLWGVILCRR